MKPCAKAGLLVAAALLAASLAACTTPPESTAPQNTPAPTAAPTQAPAPTAAPTPDDRLSDAMRTALDGCVAYGADSAGGSLKAQYAAVTLTDALLVEGSPSETAFVAWHLALTAEQQELWVLNWPGIRDNVQKVIDDPEAATEEFNTNGVQADYTGTDLTTLPASLAELDALSAAHTGTAPQAPGGTADAGGQNGTPADGAGAPQNTQPVK